MRPIEQAAYWLAQRPAPPPPVTLAGETRADIVIIGGGFTGLWTAVRLKELAPSCDLALVEQAVLGYGGSGRNAGHVSGTIDHSLAQAVTHFGWDEARRLARLGLENLEEFARFLAETRIDCGFERSGQLLVALNDGQSETARRGLEQAARLGRDDHRLLTAAETRAEINSPLYHGAVFDPGWAIIDPIRLVDGLRRVAEQRGTRMYERSPVTGIAPDRTGVTVTTAAGRIRADRVILATNAYSHQLWPRLARRFIPLYDYVIVSEPLTAEQRARIGWPHRQAVIDGRHFFNYYRLTDDQRILWGSSDARYYPPNRVGTECDHSERHYRLLRDSFCRHFPQLADLAFPYTWGGPIASTTRLTPFFGQAAGGRLIYGLGYTGLGIANSHLAGKILAHLALDKPSPLLELDLVRRPPLPFPPGGLRSLAVNLVTRDLRRVDQGHRRGLLLRLLDRSGVGFSS